MNQEKIGKYIAEKRKERKLTQQELAERLGVTNRSVSNWENGKNMPDLSLFKPLCQELDISINDLMSGEKIDKKNYIDALEENVVNMVSSLESKRKRKMRFLLISLITAIILFIIVRCFYVYYEIDVKYDNRVMSCEIKEKELAFTINGQSTLNTYYTSKEIGNKQIYFFHSTINLYNKRRSNWEYSQSMARLLDGKDVQFESQYTLELTSDKIKAYYTDKSISEINRANEKELEKIIEESYLMCNN